MSYLGVSNRGWREDRRSWEWKAALTRFVDVGGRRLCRCGIGESEGERKRFRREVGD